MPFEATSDADLTMAEYLLATMPRLATKHIAKPAIYFIFAIGQWSMTSERRVDLVVTVHHAAASSSCSASESAAAGERK